MVSVPLWVPESDFRNSEAWILIELHAALIPIVPIHSSGMTLIVEGYLYSRSCKESRDLWKRTRFKRSRFLDRDRGISPTKGRVRQVPKAGRPMLNVHPRDAIDGQIRDK